MAQMILYLDPWSGVSGDMLLAALLDLDRGNDRLETELRRVLDALGMDAALIEISREVEWGVACTRVRVRDEGAAPLRHLADMERMIGEATLSDGVRATATEAVRRLAAVEAAIHSCSVDEIHFHEVGAVDTLVDIVGTLALVEALDVRKVMVGTIPVGGGMVEIAHGRMGAPAPATAKLLEGYEIVGGPEMRELTTPTGALLLGRLGAAQGPLPAMKVESVGYGAGSMRLEGGPNVLRAVLGSATEADTAEMVGRDKAGADEVVELQTNLDQVSPEVIGHTVAALREAGALDVWTVAADMKKDRPGVVLHALVEADAEDALTDLLFRESGTLGIRRHPVRRRIATRGVVDVKVAGEEITVKWGRWQGQLVNVAPEYEDAARTAKATGSALKDVMQQAVAAAHGLLCADAAED
jgi:uncharacterized protein (TIGR00299 family) protein